MDDHGGARLTLDESRRALVLKHLDLGPIVAREIRNRRMTVEERESAALFGVCLAALHYPGGGDFRGYARVRARWQVLGELRALSRRMADPLDDDPIDGHDLFSAIEATDELASLMAAIPTRLDGRRTDGGRFGPGMVQPATDRQWEALRLYGEGRTAREIGAALGCTPKAADHLVARLITRLRNVAENQRGNPNLARISCL